MPCPYDSTTRRLLRPPEGGRSNDTGGFPLTLISPARGERIRFVGRLDSCLRRKDILWTLRQAQGEVQEVYLRRNSPMNWATTGVAVRLLRPSREGLAMT